jgi:hypothetical protein
MSIPSRWPSHADAVKARWFSRRHETNAAHQAEQQKRERELSLRQAREQNAQAAWEEKQAARLAKKAA